MIKKSIKKLAKNIQAKLTMNLSFKVEDSIMFHLMNTIILILLSTKKNNKMMILSVLLNKYGIFLHQNMIMSKLKDLKEYQKKVASSMMVQCINFKLLLLILMTKNLLKVSKVLRLCQKEILMINFLVKKCNYQLCGN